MQNSTKSSDSETLAIVREKERQKTKRYLMFLSFMAVIAVVGIFVVFTNDESGGKRKVDIDLSKGKLTFAVEKPILQQVNQPTSKYNTGESAVEFTTGTVSPAVLQQIEENFPSIEPTGFVGRNFVNKLAGFLLTVNHPESWQVSYNPGGMMNPLLPINQIFTADGSHLNITREQLMFGQDLETYVTASLQNILNLGVILDYPEVSYDYASNTAFLSYVNPYTSGETYQKVVVKGGYAYIATANYNNMLSNAQRVSDLIEMVATFTLIGA